MGVGGWVGGAPRSVLDAHGRTHILRGEQPRAHYPALVLLAESYSQPVGSSIHEKDFFPGLPSLLQVCLQPADPLLQPARQHGLL